MKLQLVARLKTRHSQYQYRNGNRGIESFGLPIDERSQYQCERRIEPLGRLRDERVHYQYCNGRQYECRNGNWGIGELILSHYLMMNAASTSARGESSFSVGSGTNVSITSAGM
ncbi:unnamed protein product [Sphagnum troendelagicum]